jgi:hypothetical protein
LTISSESDGVNVSEVQLVVREWDRDWSGPVHGSQADRAIAALTADPETLEELELALGRFAKPNLGDRHDLGLEPGLRDSRYDAGRIVIDLAARLVVIDSDYSDPEREGIVYYHNGQYRTSHALPYQLADDWVFSHAFWEWRQVATNRRLERAGRSASDPRLVLYGPPLLESIARETCQSAQRLLAEIHSTPSDAPLDALPLCATPLPHEPLGDFSPALLMDDSGNCGESDCQCQGGPPLGRATLNEQAAAAAGGNPISREIRELHARWLLSPREDLGGQTPREILFLNRRHLSQDLHNRCESWSLTGLAPPPLPLSSPAFQSAGIGLHEAVMYYHLVRELLWSSWEHWSETLRGPQAVFSATPQSLDESIAAEAERLVQVRDQWLDSPAVDSGHRTPRSIIQNERRRVPEALTPEEALIDPDCPCCQMLAELPGPCFWHLDGSDLDEDFAFDVHEATFADWEQSRWRWDDDTCESGLGATRCDSESNPRVSPADAPSGSETSSILTATSAASASTATATGIQPTASSPPLPIGLAVYIAALHVAELISAIQSTGPRKERTTSDERIPADERMMEHLNRHFGNLRALLPTPNQTTWPGGAGDSLLLPALERLYETLAEVSVAHPQLDALCQNLAHELSRIVQAALGAMAPPPGRADTSGPSEPGEAPGRP